MEGLTFSQRAVEAAAEAVLECRARMAASFDSPDPTEIAYDEFLARAALNAALAVDGVALVPKEPTQAMLQSAHDAPTYWHHDTSELDAEWFDEMRVIYRAMLAAASNGDDRQ